MNTKFENFPSMCRCTGLRSRLSYFSVTGVDAPGARLSGQQACFYPRLVCSVIRTDL